jgi:hypothetical protein
MITVSQCTSLDAKKRHVFNIFSFGMRWHEVEVDAIGDRGYFKGEEILACETAGVTPIVPKPLTSGAKADDRFGYDPGEDVPRCPGGEMLTWRY